MPVPYSCLPCYLNQTLSLIERKVSDDAKARQLLHAALDALKDFDNPEISGVPELAGKLYKALSDALDDPDPFAAEKQQANNMMQAILPDLRTSLEESPDRFAAAVSFAVAGNIIDFGALPDLQVPEAIDMVKQASKAPIAINHTQELRQNIAEAGSILYIGDNTGEILADRLLLEQLPLEKTTFVVRGAAVLNDITIEDAAFAGIDGMCKVITTGSAVPGISFSGASEEFLQAFDSADVVIAKGQGNYESIYPVTKREVFFLMKVKCDVIARHIGAATGDHIVYQFKGNS